MAEQSGRLKSELGHEPPFNDGVLTRYKPVRRKDSLSRVKIIVPLLLVLGGCTGQYEAPIMYQAVTPGCDRWVDGSSFDLPEEISVVAGSPSAVGEQALDLDLSYLIPKGAKAEFVDQKFLLTLAHGEPVAEGEVVKVERVLPAPKWLRESLPSLMQTLRGENFDDETVYQIKIRFRKPLPQRFDFTPPSIIIVGKTYPIRTYTYRWFASRNAYGLCT
jgi:hypothetical protein